MSYPNIMDVPTNGASAVTAAQDQQGYSKVTASKAMARTDSDRMEKYRSKIKRVGHSYGIDPALIAGIISRESRAGNQLENGWGDNRKAWGLMQVDVTKGGGGHPRIGEWDSEEHLRQATGILVGFIGVITNKFPNWSRNDQLKGGIAAYNQGDGNVRDGYGVDHFTTGGDYSNDVVARAQYYKESCGY